MNLKRNVNFLAAFVMTLMTSGYVPVSSAAPLSLANKPLFLGATAPPMLMMVMGRNHKLYYEAYNDTSDLNNDGIIDVGYKPTIDYYGYFNSYACYGYENNVFVPKSIKSDADKAANKKGCSGSSGEWSGDFLNYITTARIDALRKVFYGGYRSTDSSSKTVLERSEVPPDAHSWAKEYRGVAIEGYSIEDYTPLPLPPIGKGHLFGNLSESKGGDPILKILPNTRFRSWEWASTERPVLSDKCIPGVGQGKVDCETSSGGSAWELARESLFKNLTVNYHETSRSSNISAGEFDAMVAAPGSIIGVANRPLIQMKGGDLARDNFLSVVKGKLVVPSTGDYTFAVNGDDAVEFVILSGGIVKHRIGWYGGHSACSSDTCLDDHSKDSANSDKKSVNLIKGEYSIEFRHHELTGGNSFELYQKKQIFESKFSKYAVRVQVCKSAGLLEDNCATYSDGSNNTSYKPTGLLHTYGENESILFGLLTGSYKKNLDGGVLRKNISSFRNEINSNDGTFSSMNGIVRTIDKFSTVGFNWSSWEYNCGLIAGRPMRSGECEMWGNPIAEMMYEGVRYFQGKGSPTPEFKISSSGNSDASLGLPLPDWKNPYDKNSGGQPYCSNPYMMVVSDINPNYDSDKLPGSSFTYSEGGISKSFAGDVSGMNVSTLADTITNGELDIKGLRYIGESGSVSDSAPTAKEVTSLASIRGLSPEEPTKMGSYYSAAVAYYGWLTDLFPAEGLASKPTRINTFAVALASPLPRIAIPMGGGKVITLVPFAKSVGGGYGIDPAPDKFQPTNTITDFYVESITPTEGSFLINFEDVEQGNDHDMDAIVRYQYKLETDNTVTVTLNSLYASGGIVQHMGYVISGSDKDGIYLAVRDEDSSGNDLYYLDTPAGVNPGGSRGTDKLTLFSKRNFKVGTAVAATLLKDPLYYAAKWGGFIDSNDDNTPDVDTEWDAKNNITQANGSDGVPDNYFLVTNALGLEEQLSAAFNTILEREASSSTVTVNSGELNTDTLLFQATFNADDWSGNVLAYPVEKGAVGVPEWNLKAVLKNQFSSTDGHDSVREVITYNTTENKGVPFRWAKNADSPTGAEISQVQVDALRGGVTTEANVYGEAILNFIRGDKSEAGANSTQKFRERESILGDIVNSDPVFVPPPGFFYPDTWPGSAAENGAAYSAFRKALKARDPVLYFGANDGLFHAINAYGNNTDVAKGPIVTDGGEELLAYVPSMVFGQLEDLANTNYTHQYYVDGPSTYGDVFFGGKWHTALVGSLRSGGQGLFALDITDPKGITSLDYPSFDESNAEKLVLWEYSDSDTGGADLGYTFGKPIIVRMNNGKWAAVFGNGYNNTENDGNASTTGNAVLYIVDIEDGSLIRKLDTGVGSAADPEGISRPNGMAGPAVIDLNGDRIADAIYAGDLFGNMWKIDVTDSSADQWDFAHKQDTSPTPLFIAKNKAGNRLPITAAPAVGSHPTRKADGSDVLVYFGTGKYFESSDNNPDNQYTQAFFAVWDDGTNDASRSNMLEQKILAETTVKDYQYRLVTKDLIRWEEQTEADGTKLNPHRGWYIDLLNTQGGNTANMGERVVYEPIIRNDRIIFTTLIPSLDQCAAGGSGWLMELNAISGARLESSPFDLNNDGLFNELDLIDFGDGGKHPSGGLLKLDGGIPTQPAIADDPDSCESGQCTEKKFIGTSNATIEVITESSGPATQRRQNWREVN